MIKVQDVSTKIGDRQILDRVDFQVQAGETVALVGANGAGKTTMLRCLLGIVHYSGAIEIDGIDLQKDPVAGKKRIGYMPQVPAFCEQLVAESLAFVAKLREVNPAEIWTSLERVGLSRDAARPVRVLSTGMRQRLSLAAALLGQPPILILDEPTASLDLKGQAEIIRLLQELQSRGQTILMSSHRAEEVRALAQKVIVMDEGKVVEVLKPVRCEGADATENLSEAEENHVFRARRVK